MFSVEYANSHIHVSVCVINIFSPPGQAPVFLSYRAANSPPGRTPCHKCFPLTRLWASLLYPSPALTSRPYFHRCSKQGVTTAAGALYFTFAGPSLIFLIWSLYFTSSASSREIFLSMDSALLSTLSGKTSKAVVIIAIFLHEKW